MSGNKDFIEILREIRGSAAPGQPITDGIWYELTTADTNGNPGIYGDILAKYGIIVGDGGAIEQITASVQAALESEEASAQSANEAEAARDTILNMQVATGAPESAVTWDGTTLTVPKGDKGETGVSVESIVRTNGDGSAGTFDTYTITLTDASTSTFTVYNGGNGTNGVDGEIGPTGNGIVNITRTNGTGQAGTIDTYTITLSDASTSTFDVYNGVDGNDGANGLDGNGIATILRTNGNGAAGTIDTYTITYNDTTTTTFNVYNGANGINGLDGIDGTNGLDGRGIVGIARTSGTGQPGETDEYTITYTDASTSVFNVYNGTNGTNGTNGLDGTDGVDGRGVVSTVRTSGTGLAGTTDTYTMTYTDATTSTFTVYNGADGTGSGDMSKSVYDTTNNGKVDTAEVAESVPWTGITDKPTTYPPETHTHDDLYEPANTNIQTHIASTSNPHSVTKAQVGLSDVDNTADNVKAVLSASKLTTGVDISLSGDATGVVTFDGSVNVDMVVTVANDSHTHDSRYYTESETDVLLADKEPLLPVTPVNPTTKYLRGDKQWAEIVVGSGGYASNLYMTNDASTVVGSYKQTSYALQVSPTTISAVANNNEVLMATYLYEQQVATTTLDAGSWYGNFYASVSSTLAGNSSIRVETFVRAVDGTEIVLFSVTTPTITSATGAYIRVETSQPAFTVNATDRVGHRVYAVTTATNNRTISYVVGDGNASYFNTPVAIRHSQLRNVEQAGVGVLDGHINSGAQTIAGEKTFVDTVSVPVIELDTANVIGPSVGQMAWNQDEQTVDIGLVGGVTLQAGQETVKLVRNGTGSMIPNGTAVMATGSIGNSGRIVVAPSTGLAVDAKRTYGVTTQDITAGADGYITVDGKVRDIDTTGIAVGETWADGDILYVKPNDSGRLTKVEPAANELKMAVAQVVHAHAAGTLEVRIGSVINENAYTPRVASTANRVVKFSGTTGEIVDSNLVSNSGGDLGLGVSPSIWHASVRALETLAGAIFNVNGTALRMIQNAYYSVGSFYSYKTTAPATLYSQEAGAHTWSTAPSGTAGTTVTFTERMKLDNTGVLTVNGAEVVKTDGVKTVNGQSIVGTGDIVVGGSSESRLYFYGGF